MQKRLTPVLPIVLCLMTLCVTQALYAQDNSDEKKSIDIQGLIYGEMGYQNRNKNTTVNPDNIFRLHDLNYYFRGNITAKSAFNEHFSGHIKLEAQAVPQSYAEVTDDEREKVFIRSLLFNVNTSYFSLQAGKQYIKWGKGYFFNPSDILNNRRDPLRPLDEAKGNYFTMITVPIQSFASIDLLTRVTRSTESDLGSRDNWHDLPVIGKVSMAAGDFSGFFAGKYDVRDKQWYCLNSEFVASLTKNVSINIYEEASYRIRSRKNVVATDPAFTVTEQGAGRYWAVVGGAKMTIGFEETSLVDAIEIRAEYYYDSENWSRKEFRDYLDYLEYLYGLSPADKAALESSTGMPFSDIFKSQALMTNAYGNGRDYVYAGVTFSSLFVPYLDLIVDYALNIRDISGIVKADLRYNMAEDLYMGIYGIASHGGKRSEFGNNYNSFQVSGYTQVAF